MVCRTVLVPCLIWSQPYLPTQVFEQYKATLFRTHIWQQRNEGDSSSHTKDYRKLLSHFLKQKYPYKSQYL